jgi:uncharacterized protein DUF6527
VKYQIRPWVNPSVNERGTHVHFWCPGCDHLHAIEIEGPHAWEFAVAADLPTVSPSILTHWHDELGDRRCHSFIKGGRWEFLSDCTHSLAGKTVEMVDLPDWLVSEL